MKFIIDDADIAKIKDIYNTFAVDGVTTNPSILAKSGRQPYEVLTEIREFIGPDAELHVQVIAPDAEGMVRDGHRIVEVLGKNTYVKVPTTKEGLRAMKLLHAEGIRVTATAIYTRMQAFLAAKAGADYAAPYVNRIDNLGGDGVKTAQDIHDIFRKNELCEYGIGAATISPDVIEALIKNDSVAMAVEAFVKDFEGLCGKGVTMETSK